MLLNHLKNLSGVTCCWLSTEMPRLSILPLPLCRCTYLCSTMEELQQHSQVRAQKYIDVHPQATTCIPQNNRLHAAPTLQVTTFCAGTHTHLAQSALWYLALLLHQPRWVATAGLLHKT